jgi:fumarate reductase flavoprotein subunit
VTWWGGGGAGLRAAIAAAEADPGIAITLVSKVYPMRSHTVAAEGGSAAVTREDDSLAHHFHDTVAGGDWLCDQDAVDYFVAQCTRRWCSWSTGAAHGAACPMAASTCAPSAA